MPYVKITNGQVDQYPYTIGLLRRDNPNTSFPKSLTESTLNEWGVYSVEATDQPSFNKATQYVVEVNPVLENGTWKTSWQVNTRTAEEQSAYDTEAAINSRQERDGKIADTDWWASSDLTMTAEQTAYRQALRDITTHANWPHLEESDWPTKP